LNVSAVSWSFVKELTTRSLNLVILVAIVVSCSTFPVTSFTLLFNIFSKDIPTVCVSPEVKLDLIILKSVWTDVCISEKEYVFLEVSDVEADFKALIADIHLVRMSPVLVS